MVNHFLSDLVWHGLHELLDGSFDLILHGHLFKLVATSLESRLIETFLFVVGTVLLFLALK
jgi:hypothetical protein